MLPGLRYRFRNAIAANPRLYFPLYRLFRTRRHGLLSATTELTIEGFPRSGNSFALRAFESVNPDVSVAHHTHAAAQVIGSVKRGLPTLILIREPEAAIKSLLVMRPEIPPAAAVKSYLQFYGPLERWLDHMVLASFDEVTADFGEVMRRVNHRFGTAFRVFTHAPEQVAAVFARIESLDAQAGGGRVRARQVAKPSAARERLKVQISLQQCSGLLHDAAALYEKLLRIRPPS